MASFNEVILVGRLGRDPETRAFANGGKVAKFSIAVDKRKKNASGTWEKAAVWVDVEAFNRGDTGKLADLVEQYVHKGSLILVRGEIDNDEWMDKSTNQKRSKLKIVADKVEFLDSKRDAGSPPSSPSYSQPEPQAAPAADKSGVEEETPF